MDKAMHSEFDEQRAGVLTHIARPIVKNDLVAAFASDEDLLIYEHFFIRGMEHINYQVSELLEIIDNNNGVHSDSELETIKKCRSIPSESLRSELQKQKEEFNDTRNNFHQINKQLMDDLVKQKELNAELVEYLKLARTDMVKLGMDPGHNHVHKISSAIKRVESLIKKSQSA